MSEENINQQIFMKSKFGKPMAMTKKEIMVEATKWHAEVAQARKIIQEYIAAKETKYVDDPDANYNPFVKNIVSAPASGMGWSTRGEPMSMDEVKELAFKWREERDAMRRGKKYQQLPARIHEQDEDDNLQMKVTTICKYRLEDLGEADLRATIEWLAKEHNATKRDLEKLRRLHRFD